MIKIGNQGKAAPNPIIYQTSLFRWLKPEMPPGHKISKFHLLLALSKLQKELNRTLNKALLIRQIYLWKCLINCLLIRQLTNKRSLYHMACLWLSFINHKIWNYSNKYTRPYTELLINFTLVDEISASPGRDGSDQWIRIRRKTKWFWHNEDLC